MLAPGRMTDLKRWFLDRADIRNFGEGPAGHRMERAAPDTALQLFGANGPAIVEHADLGAAPRPADRVHRQRPARERALAGRRAGWPRSRRCRRTRSRPPTARRYVCANGERCAAGDGSYRVPAVVARTRQSVASIFSPASTPQGSKIAEVVDVGRNLKVADTMRGSDVRGIMSFSDAIEWPDLPHTRQSRYPSGAAQLGGKSPLVQPFGSGSVEP